MPLNATEKKRKRQEESAVHAVAKALKYSPDELSKRRQVAEEALAKLSILPKVVVLDLDNNVWIGDIDMTSGPPFTSGGRNQPIVAQKGHFGDKVVPYPDVAEIVDWIHEKNIKLAVSTHSFKPDWAYAALGLMKTAEGIRYSDLAVCRVPEKLQRKPKDVHMRHIAEGLGCGPTDMVFFDDTAHNCSDCRKIGVTSVVTEDGLNWEKFVQCLQEFATKTPGTPGTAVSASPSPSLAAALAAVSPSASASSTLAPAVAGASTAGKLSPNGGAAAWSPPAGQASANASQQWPPGAWQGGAQWAQDPYMQVYMQAYMAAMMHSGTWQEGYW